METQKRTLIIAAAVFACGILALAALVASALTVWRAQSDAADVGSLLLERSSKEKGLERAAAQARATVHERQMLAQHAIPEDGGAAFIESLDGLAKVSNVEAEIQSVNATEPAGFKPGTLLLSLRFSGTYQAADRFLRLLETRPEGVTISALSLAYDEASKHWSGTLSLAAISFDTP